MKYDGLYRWRHEQDFAYRPEIIFPLTHKSGDTMSDTPPVSLPVLVTKADIREVIAREASLIMLRLDRMEKALADLKSEMAKKPK